MFSNDYIKQLQRLHSDRSRPRGFGGKVKDIGKFHYFMEQWKPISLLDYGCGKGLILETLKEKYKDTVCTGYDPAVPMFSKDPIAVDCVFSNDVLEHIEPEYLEDVLRHINTLSLKFVWLRIDTIPARKSLPDGRNAHLILENPNWWKDKIEKIIDGNIVYFELNKKGKLDVAIEK
jgi:hypothetical protein